MEEAADVKVRVYYAPELDTLDLWLDEPGRESFSEPLNDNIVLKLDERREVIGLEIVSLGSLTREDVQVIPEGVRRVLLEALKRLYSRTLARLEA
ncbi:DUF2283 domain-containing protein [Thermofilum pendens]|uniref:DUF2283 domain-containing protein n=1 Tax=Thermofilum pendens (strain DSM 2475 / Hrk 5) TaxID=368408 RepID=A1S0Z9_THEPD|nr:DUF2283 domain-containing protein [Thermofilum pendens]ABL79129.1 hypothetical protein Tpen_1734 [Thermofilum pendens Hrk 5]